MSTAPSGEATVRVRTQAEIEQLQQYTAELRKFREELTRTAKAIEDYNRARASGGGDGGGDPDGSGPAPGHVAPTPPGGGGTPPAAPPPSSGAMGTHPTPSGRIGSQGGAAPPPPSGPSAVLPPPGPAAGAPGASGGAPPPGWTPSPNGQGWQSPTREYSRSKLNRAGGFISNVASTAIGVGLGNSLFGFFLSSGQKFMELSKVITLISRRFREAGENAAFFGGELGYTVAESARLAETLGSEIDGSDETKFKKAFRRYAGFARDRGLDPNQAMQIFGELQHTMSRELDDNDLARLAQRASEAGMGQGRFAEHVQSTIHLAQQQFQTQGSSDFGRLMGLQSLPGVVFGGANDPRAQGEAGVGFLNRLQGVMTGGGPMKTFMLRAMGYGREGTMGGELGYIEAKKRLEAGIHDPENITDLFEAFQARGFGKGAQFRALESVSGGQLKAHEIESLVETLGTKGGLEKFRQAHSGSDADVQKFLDGLSPEDQALFLSQGFFGMGRGPGRISMGEGAAVQMEGMQMSVGQHTATAILDLREVLMNAVGSFKNLTEIDLGGSLTAMTGHLRDISSYMEEGTRKGGEVRDLITAPSRFISEAAEHHESIFSAGGSR